MASSRRQAVFLGDDCIGHVTWDPMSDFPWAHGDFEPSPQFAAHSTDWKPLDEEWFDESDDADEVDAGDEPEKTSAADEAWQTLDFEALRTRGIPSDRVRLVSDDGQEDYLMALNLDGKGRASWRIGIEPLDLDLS
ncbi:hypothetical protein [Chondromyces crocatus]|uniref:Uncharacterized protein n=1 Tax=Chondromyces crocatus TaxID=52 RepID=A0A0K1EF98_CHOCO|nr:hypothetical protein [Chondromyces crocatus]AKT39541.1 uncharacterized protein CMC5_036880 [Chondromyces crocatus]